MLDLIAYHDPGFHTVIRVWYYVAPAVAVLLAGRVRAMACRRAGVQGIEGGGATLASPCRGPAKRGPKG